MNGPLDGVKVLEWAQWIQGPTVGFMLGDLGAEVIKIENPEGGDAGRAIVQTSQLRSAREGFLSRNFFFESCYRNKRSVTIDLKQEKGREIVYKLVETADVFVHNFRYKVTKRLGVDYETLSQYNPKLIYAEDSGFGPEGPERDRAVWEPIV